jgi:hypothetical protein
MSQGVCEQARQLLGGLQAAPRMRGHLDEAVREVRVVPSTSPVIVVLLAFGLLVPIVTRARRPATPGVDVR